MTHDDSFLPGEPGPRGEALISRRTGPCAGCGKMPDEQHGAGCWWAFKDTGEQKFSLVPDLLTGTEVFMDRAGQEFGAWPLPFDHPIRELRRRLIGEEVGDEYFANGEYAKNMATAISETAPEDNPNLGDVVEIADGLVDSIVVIWGTLLAYFGPACARALAAEVTRSNLSKVVGTYVNEGGTQLPLPIKDEGGKVIKPPGFTKPDIAAVLRAHGFEV